MAAPELKALSPGDSPGMPVGEEVHLWSARVLSETETPDDAALLSVAERLRASRFRFDRDRRRYTGARARLRRVLAACSGLPPDALTLEADALGKPWLVQDRGLHFNLSHCGDELLIGVTRLAPIGVDLEAVRTVSGSSGIAQASFSAAEQGYLASHSSADQPTAFFRVWTAKEAVVKALGTGFTTPLDSFSALPASPPNDRVSLSGLAGQWTLRLVSPQPGYLAALAVRANRVCLRHGQLTPRMP